MLHTFVALVQDKPGVLTRVASLFRRLNINIVSLTVGQSERDDTSRMTIVCDAPEHAAHRIRASLYKLETTVDVDEVSRSEAVIRELCLIKVAAGPSSPHGTGSRGQIFEFATVFKARVVDLAPESIMLEMTGSASKIEGLVQVLTESGFTILETSRPAAWPCAAAITPAASSRPSAHPPEPSPPNPTSPTNPPPTKSSPTSSKTCTKRKPDPAVAAILSSPNILRKTQISSNYAALHTQNTWHIHPHYPSKIESESNSRRGPHHQQT